MNEKEVILECKQGDFEIFHKIVDMYSGKVLAVALNILKNKQEAEDACQEAFLKAFLHIDKFDIQKDFKAWIYSIVCHQCLDQIRKKKRFYNFFNKMKKETSEISNPKSVKPKQRDSLPSRLLDVLNPREKVALCLWANEGYTGEEIAQSMRCSASTARVHLFKARKKIKAILEKKNV